MHAARAMEEVRLLQAGFMVNSGDVMVATKNSTIQFLGQDLGSGISRMECVIPVLILPDDVNEADAIKEACQVIPIRAISAGETIRKALLTSKNSAEFVQNLLVVGPGMLQCQPFDGTHLGHPFFGMRQ